MNVNIVRAGTEHLPLLAPLFDGFRRLTMKRSWRTPTVKALARSAYDDRILPAGHLDLHRLAVLADALEDAGCSDAEILAQLRGAGPHVRGCWVVDLLLGKK